MRLTKKLKDALLEIEQTRTNNRAMIKTLTTDTKKKLDRLKLYKLVRYGGKDNFIKQKEWVELTKAGEEHLAQIATLSV